MKKFLIALGLRTLDLIRSAGSPPYEVFNAQAVGSRSVHYSLQHALDASDNQVDSSKKGPMLVWVNGERFRFTVDARGRKHLPLVLRRRMFR